MDIRIGNVGRIIGGDEVGKYLKIVDDSARSGGFLILVTSDKEMKDGHDYWVEDKATLERFFRESRWSVEWEAAAER